MITNDLENSKNHLVNDSVMDQENSSRESDLRHEQQGNSITDGDTPYKSNPKKYKGINK